MENEISWLQLYRDQAAAAALFPSPDETTTEYKSVFITRRKTPRSGNTITATATTWRRPTATLSSPTTWSASEDDDETTTTRTTTTRRVRTTYQLQTYYFHTAPHKPKTRVSFVDLRYHIFFFLIISLKKLFPFSVAPSRHVAMLLLMSFIFCTLFEPKNCLKMAYRVHFLKAALLFFLIRDNPFVKRKLFEHYLF